MDGVEDSRVFGPTAGKVSVLLILPAIALAFGANSPSAPAQTPFGSNDTSLAAAGPVLSGQPLTGTFGSASDIDFFFFYVSAASGQSFLTLDNLGGGKQPGSGITARIMDSASTPVQADFGYIIRQGESHTAPITLDPGKYFIEIVTREGDGDSYRLTAGSDGSAFGAYTPIATQCEAADASLGVVKRQLERARTKLQRAVNRVRRNKYASPETKRKARVLRTRAMARVAAKTRSVKTATQARSPWCFIPQ